MRKWTLQTQKNMSTAYTQQATGEKKESIPSILLSIEPFSCETIIWEKLNNFV